jgi:hypothetical protein
MPNAEVVTHEDIVSMVERAIAISGNRAADSMLELLRRDEALARKYYDDLSNAQGLDDTISRGVLDELALSTLTSVGAGQLKTAYPNLIERLSIYAPSIPRVRLVVTPSLEFQAKMHLRGRECLCCLSLGLIATVQCVALCLVCRTLGWQRETVSYVHTNAALRFGVVPVMKPVSAFASSLVCIWFTCVGEAHAR